MRNAEDMQELDDHYRDEEPPPRPCPECGDDDRHDPDCSRNYRNMRPVSDLMDAYFADVKAHAKSRLRP